jgi:hypothetical protein
LQQEDHTVDIMVDGMAGGTVDGTVDGMADIAGGIMVDGGIPGLQ